MDSNAAPITDEIPPLDSSILTARKEKRMERRMAEKKFLTQTVFLALFTLLVFVLLQQLSVGVQYLLGLASLFSTPYLIVLLIADLRTQVADGEAERRGIAKRFNTIIGPGIVSLAISSCIFSAPLEGRVWIVGNRTTGSEGTLFAIPVFSKITSVMKHHDVVMNLSAKTSDGIIVNSHMIATVVCCADDPDKILQTYQIRKPNDLVKNYITAIFDASFRESAAAVPAAKIKTAYGAMAKNISRKRIMSDMGLLWNGKFSVIESHAPLPVN